MGNVLQPYLFIGGSYVWNIRSVMSFRMVWKNDFLKIASDRAFLPIACFFK
jgi:hypothetical protein